MGTQNAVCGIYDSRISLEAALNELKLQGFNSSDISILMHNYEITEETKAPEGIAAGASTGILGGSILGWLAGAGALAIPGVGPFVAAGPIMAAIAGAGIGGTVGGITGGLIGMGIPEDEAQELENHVRDGGIFLTVHVDTFEQSTNAREILERTGARSIVRKDNYHGEGEGYSPRHTGYKPDSYSNEL